MPTAMAAAGIDAVPEWQLDGVNLLPHLLKENSESPITQFNMNPFFPVNTLQIMRGAIYAQQTDILERFVE